jgi:hypothetical protein
MKFGVILDVAPCSRVEVDRRFRGAYCLYHQGDESRINRNFPEILVVVESDLLKFSLCLEFSYVSLQVTMENTARKRKHLLWFPYECTET